MLPVRFLVLCAVLVGTSHICLAATTRSVVYQRQRKVVRNRVDGISNGTGDVTIIREIFRTQRRPSSLARTDSQHIERQLKCDTLCQRLRQRQTTIIKSPPVTRLTTPTPRTTTMNLAPQRPPFLITGNPYENTNPDYTNLLQDPVVTTSRTTSTTTVALATSTTTTEAPITRTTSTTTVAPATSTTTTTTEAPATSTSTSTTEATAATTEADYDDLVSTDEPWDDQNGDGVTENYDEYEEGEGVDDVPDYEEPNVL